MTAATFDKNVDEIQDSITSRRDALKRAKDNITDAVNGLTAIPTVYADTVTAAGALGTTGYDAQQKARWQAYVAEFTALKTQATQAMNALSAITFE